jgi:hypothetical protein
MRAGKTARKDSSTWLPFIGNAGWENRPQGFFDLAAVHQKGRLEKKKE